MSWSSVGNQQTSAWRSQSCAESRPFKTSNSTSRFRRKNKHVLTHRSVPEAIIFVEWNWHKLRRVTFYAPPSRNLFIRKYKQRSQAMWSTWLLTRMINESVVSKTYFARGGTARRETVFFSHSSLFTQSRVRRREDGKKHFPVNVALIKRQIPAYYERKQPSERNIDIRHRGCKPRA